jgi:hypothetical protein
MGEPISQADYDSLVCQEVKETFKLAGKILEEASKKSNRSHSFDIDEWLLAFICAKQIKHHIVEESDILKRQNG